MLIGYIMKIIPYSEMQEHFEYSGVIYQFPLIFQLNMIWLPEDRELQIQRWLQGEF